MIVRIVGLDSTGRLRATSARKPLAHEVAAPNDTELDQCLEENKHVVTVKDPDQLPAFFCVVGDKG